MMDFLFMEFYIKKKYNKTIEEYFDITRQSKFAWMKNNQIPEKRLLQFYKNEGSLNPNELFENFYK